MTLTFIRDNRRIPSDARQNVATIGNFDGVHLGHQALIQQAKIQAKMQNTQALVITFEPHPLEFFAEKPLPRITNLREKYQEITKLGIHNILVLPFNQKLARKSASDFAKEILHDKLNIRHLVVGEDFRFGFKREGDVALLAALGKQLGFTVETIPPVFINQARVSSTRIRETLQQADLASAKALLGRPYTISGRVKFGDQRGRQFGFPTANIFLKRKLVPLSGVFTVLVHSISTQPLPGVANIGVRPTVDGSTCLLEVHLLDFNQDIYGHQVQIEFCKKLRDEIRFDHVDLLIKQIRDDVDRARDYFLKQGVL